jgi:hypothetical protein
MCLVLGVVEVDMRHHARILGASASNELSGGCQELVGDGGRLAQPSPRRSVAGLPREAARLPQRVGAVVMPGLNVDVIRNDERYGDELLIAAFPAPAVPLV